MRLHECELNICGVLLDLTAPETGVLGAVSSILWYLKPARLSHGRRRGLCKK